MQGILEISIRFKYYVTADSVQKNVTFVIYTDTLNWKALLKLPNSEVDSQNKNRARYSKVKEASRSNTNSH